LFFFSSEKKDVILSPSSLLSTLNIYQVLFRILSEGQSSSHLYLLLPYYETGTLQSYLRTPGRTLSINQCSQFLRSLASAICYLHLGRSRTHLSIVHRDIKSSNILVHKDELRLSLADFGVAAILPQVLSEKDFVQIGTMRYMAPELLEGVIAYTHDALYSVDMYALALVMWEIVTHCDIYPVTGNDKQKKRTKD
jgi:serine/threonine protein kinase